MEHNEAASKRIYEPLRVDREEFRLLTLHAPGPDDAILRCELSLAAFSSDLAESEAIPPYECLSYVWGKPIVSVSIYLNGADYQVTPRLAHILSKLRYPDQSRVLWVDALSINQWDVEERSSQVALIGKIYSHCRRDLAWLGCEPLETTGDDKMIARRARLEEESERGMQILRQIVQHDTRTLRSFHEACKHEDDHYGECDLLQQWHGKGDTIDSWINEFDALSSILSRELWFRVWVVQELSCAPQVTLVYEGVEIEWELLSNFLRDEPYFDAFHGIYAGHGFTSGQREFRDKFAKVKLIEDQRQRLRGAIAGRRDNGERMYSTLLDALARFKGMRASDPRDRVYALLGIVTEDHGIVADYSLIVEQVYRDATTALMNLSSNLDIICQNPCESSSGHRALQQHSESNSTGEHGSSTYLPSWAAEFDNGPFATSPVLFAQRDIFNAGTRTCTTQCRFADPDKRILILRGTMLDRVGPIHQESKNQTPHETLQTYLGEDIIGAESHRQYEPRTENGVRLYEDPESALRAFWRTLVKDCTAPPGMRRLSKTEIEWLDVSNQLWLKDYEMRFDAPQTYCVGLVGGRHGSRPTDNWLGVPLEGDMQPSADPAQSDEKRLVTWMAGCMDWTFNFNVSENGLFLLVRPQAREGDIVTVLDGAKVPVILRRCESPASGDVGETFLVVGPAYVHGFMDGLAEELVQRGQLVKRDLCIV